MRCVLCVCGGGGGGQDACDRIQNLGPFSYFTSYMSQVDPGCSTVYTVCNAAAAAFADCDSFLSCLPH